MMWYLPPSCAMLYLPEGNHCGGSSGPAWVASSWVWTRPTLSYHPVPTGTADPVLLAGRKRLLHPQKTRSKPLQSLRRIPGGVSLRDRVSLPDRVSLHRATATGSRDSRSPARTPNMTTKKWPRTAVVLSLSYEGFCFLFFCKLSPRPPFCLQMFDRWRMTESVSVVSWAPVASERRPSKRRGAPLWPPSAALPLIGARLPHRRTTASGDWLTVKTLGQWETSSQLSSAWTAELIHDMQESGIMRTKNKHNCISFV